MVWYPIVPFLGGALGMLGVVAGALYWAFSRGDTSSGTGDSAVETLENRYANGKIGEEEYRRWKRRLERDQ